MFDINNIVKFLSLLTYLGFIISAFSGFKEINDIWRLRGVLGVLGGPFGVRGVRKSLGRGREVPGRCRGGPGRALGKFHFLFFRGELNGSRKYWCFLFGVVLWSGRWSLDYGAFPRFSKLVFLRNSEVNML